MKEIEDKAHMSTLFLQLKQLFDLNLTFLMHLFIYVCIM